MNHSVPQNEAGDAAFAKALDLAAEILPNGPVGVKMAKMAINKGMDVSSIKLPTLTSLCSVFFSGYRFLTARE